MSVLLLGAMLYFFWITKRHSRRHWGLLLQEIGDNRAKTTIKPNQSYQVAVKQQPSNIQRRGLFQSTHLYQQSLSYLFGRQNPCPGGRPKHRRYSERGQLGPAKTATDWSTHHHHNKVDEHLNTTNYNDSTDPNIIPCRSTIMSSSINLLSAM